MGVVALVTGVTSGPLGMGAKYLVSSALNCLGSKSPATASEALLGV